MLDYTHLMNAFLADTQGKITELQMDTIEVAYELRQKAIEDGYHDQADELAVIHAELRGAMSARILAAMERVPT
jgi:hypothetical protein